MNGVGVGFDVVGGGSRPHPPHGWDAKIGCVGGSDPHPEKRFFRWVRRIKRATFRLFWVG